MRFPDVFVIKMHDCEVTAAANARQFHIYADEKAVAWIQTGLRKAVTEYLNVKMRAMSHTAAKADAELTSSRIIKRDGVRDKIVWSSDTCTWRLQFVGAKGGDEAYCLANNISLTIPPNLQDREFKAARENAFQYACAVWNEVDKSGRRLINNAERQLGIHMVPVFRDAEGSDYSGSEG